MRPTEKIADFVCKFGHKDIPKEAIETIRAAIMDYVAVTFSGINEESSEIVRRFIQNLGGDPQATVWGTGHKTSVTLAALANGNAAHSQDYDDISLVMLAHPSIQLLPALFALGEYEHRNGSEIILAYVTGFEVGAKLGRALNPTHVSLGWLPTGTIGILMETVSCAKLLDLNSFQVQMALGIATNLASGIRCNNGTMAKHLLAGNVGSNGISAALLAREGMTANQKAIEDRFGFFENFSHKEISALEQATDTLGNPLDILQSGITFKLYPTCGGTHPAIDCALEIVRTHTLEPKDIEIIEASLSSLAKYQLIHPRPRTEAEAKFSLEYCIARAILDGQIGPAQFTPEKIKDPGVLDLIERVKPTYREDLEKQSSEKVNSFPAEIHIRMKDGTEYSSHVDYAKGTPENCLSPLEMEQKFQQCCKGRLSESQINRAKDVLRNFDQLEDMANLISIFNNS